MQDGPWDYAAMFLLFVAGAALVWSVFAFTPYYS